MRKCIICLIVLAASFVHAEKYQSVVTNWPGNVDDGGFTTNTDYSAVSALPSNPWKWNGTKWYCNGDGTGGSTDWVMHKLALPLIRIQKSGTLTIEFDHQPGFGDCDGSGAWDWGKLDYAQDGAPFSWVLKSMITSNAYDRVVRPTDNTWAFYPPATPYGNIISMDVWSSASYPAAQRHSLVNFGAVGAGETLSMRFVGGWDWSWTGGAPQWWVTNVTVKLAIPPIQNNFPTNVTATDAVLNGQLLSTGSSATAVFVYWGATDGGTNTTSWTNSYVWAAPQSTGVFSYAASSLTPSATYYYRFASTNSLGIEWADASCSFAATNALAPEVSTYAVADAGSDHAILQGQILAGNPVPYCWFYYGPTDGGSSAGSWSNSVAVGQPNNPLFSSLITGLTADQKYYYRAYVTNASGTAWAASSLWFTTASIAVSPSAVSMWAPEYGQTSSVPITFTLSSTQAVAVSFNYTTYDWTASNGVDYVTSSGSITIPAGSLSTQITVQVINTGFSVPRYFGVRITNVSNADVSNDRCVITLNKRLFIRPTGSDTTNNGLAWNRSYATLQKALNTVAENVPVNVYLEATTGSQYYAACSRTFGYLGATLQKHPLTFNVQGGWQAVDTTPVQTGMSSIQSALTNATGIYMYSPGHCGWQTLTVNHCRFANVTEGIHVEESSGSNAGGVYVNVSNTVIRALTNGVMVRYAHAYYPQFAPVASGPCQLTADNVDIVGGLGGYGNAYCSEGQWFNSTITATGINPTTGVANVSSLSSSNGSAISLTTAYQNASYSDYGYVSNTVIQGCSTNGIHVAAGTSGSKLTLRNCTIADNGGHGVYGNSAGTTSYIAATNSIFADNGGYGVSVANANFKCHEAYNVFFNDSILTNGAVQAVAGTTSTADPRFYARQDKPDPWYLLGTPASPAYHSDSTGRNRGAYQAEVPQNPTVFVFR